MDFKVLVAIHKNFTIVFAGGKDTKNLLKYLSQ